MLCLISASCILCLSRTSRNVPMLKRTHPFISSFSLALENSANKPNRRISSFHFALAFLYHFLVDLSLAPIMDSLPHSSKYSSWCRIIIFCLLFSLPNGSPKCLSSKSLAAGCACVHKCVWKRKKREKKGGKGGKEECLVLCFLTVSAALLLNDWSKCL